MRSLDEVLAELKAAEKEYAEKCLKYGIEEKQKKKKKTDEVLQDNDDSVEQTEGSETTINVEETMQEEASK